MLCETFFPEAACRMAQGFCACAQIQMWEHLVLVIESYKGTIHGSEPGVWADTNLTWVCSWVLGQAWLVCSFCFSSALSISSFFLFEVRILRKFKSLGCLVLLSVFSGSLHALGKLSCRYFEHISRLFMSCEQGSSVLLKIIDSTDDSFSYLRGFVVGSAGKVE